MSKSSRCSSSPFSQLRYVKMNPLSLQGLTPRLGTSLQLAFVYPDWLKERMSEAGKVSFSTMMWVFCQSVS